FPVDFRAFDIDMLLMEDVVEATTAEIADDERKVITLMFMPMPDGNFQRFEIWNDPILHPVLAERFPEITTFRGRGIDDETATIRLDKTPQGVHGQILSANGNIYLDPYVLGNDQVYISYYKKDFRPHPSKVRNETHPIITSTGSNTNGTTANANELYTYRLALACTGEYANFHGGTVSGALAAMTTTMNRVNGIFERDLSVRMEIIADNDLLVFLNSSSDPYTNGSGSAMLGENSSTLSSIIGNSNFDIGHVFSTGGGGVAFLGSVCTNDKARGVTGQNSPVGDPFDVDYVAHEIGHQFAGEHSWNYCFGTGGTGGTDFEPGGGSTIMGYAGLCGGDDYTNHSDPYFHGANIEQMYAFVTSGTGNNCATVTTTGNFAPTITEMPEGFTIPISTPFKLDAVVTDVEGDPMSFCWEQIDGGFNSSLLNAPMGLSPLFRSFLPVSETFRVFPQMESIVTGSLNRVEYLADYSRSMRFQLTVRDNSAFSAGISFEKAVVEVDEQGGLFEVTEPAGPGVVWEVGQWVPVNWSAGMTMEPPFNTPTVRILMSTDGGLTYPITLAEEIANNGATYVYVPDMEGEEIRIMVAANENIFFNISNEDLRIQNSGLASGLNELSNLSINIYPNPSANQVNITVSPSAALSQNAGQDLLIRIIDAVGKVHYSESMTNNGAGFTRNVDLTNLPVGIYQVEVGGSTQRLIKL
ncbi:MAG: hypothetical protein ACI959_002214, partial [Limisphaerales bacterium]